MNDQEKRTTIRAVYKTASWQEKVDKMSDQQVVAIYMKFKSEGKVS